MENSVENSGPEGEATGDGRRGNKVDLDSLRGACPALAIERERLRPGWVLLLRCPPALAPGNAPPD